MARANPNVPMTTPSASGVDDHPTIPTQQPSLTSTHVLASVLPAGFGLWAFCEVYAVRWGL
jgi:hypothetical protein